MYKTDHVPSLHAIHIHGNAHVGLSHQLTHQTPHKVDRFLVDGLPFGDGNGVGLKRRLPIENFLFQKPIALLFHIVVDDARKFFLPNTEAVDVDVVLNVPASTQGEEGQQTKQ